MVVPAQVVRELFEMIGKIDVLLLAVAFLVILVAAVSILVSIYNSMAERRRPIAIMRALGARRTTILAIVILALAFVVLALCVLVGVLTMLVHKIGSIWMSAVLGIGSKAADKDDPNDARKELLGESLKSSLASSSKSKSESKKKKASFMG